MPRNIRHACVTVAALALLALASTATARRIEASEQHIRAIFRPLTFGAAGQEPVVCNATLEASFHSRSIPKVESALVGYITEASVAGCTRETARVLRETLPWHIQYESFVGTLPDIHQINIKVLGASFLVRAFGFVSCLYRTNLAEPARFDVVTDIIERIEQLRADEFWLISGSGLCPNGYLKGSAEVNAQGTLGTKITVRLVQ
jgi:hypothetical protein